MATLNANMYPAATATRPASMEQYLPSGNQRPMVRLTTVGSVDDGKSTLIGRLLHDALASKKTMPKPSLVLGRTKRSQAE